MSDEYRAAFQQKIAAGMASAKTGRLLDGEAVFARIEAELRASDHPYRRG